MFYCPKADLLAWHPPRTPDICKATAPPRLPTHASRLSALTENGVATMNEPKGGYDMGPLRLYHGFVMEAMPQARKRCWDHGLVTEETLRRAEQIMLAGKPGTSQNLSLYRAFDRWRTRSPLVWNAPLGQVAAIFGAYLDEAGLKASTCACYVRTILGFLHRENVVLPPQWHVAQDFLRGMDLKAATEKVEHAPDITEERAAHIILALTEAQDVAFSLWAMCMAGGRVADLLRLSAGQFKVSPDGKRIAVEFLVTKSSRTQNERYSISVQSAELEATKHAVSFDSWIPFQERWRPFLLQPKPFTANVNRVNHVLDKFGSETTYSFRRLFVNRVIDRFTEDGVTEWCKVIEITGHQQKTNAKASYKTPATQRL